MDNWHFEPMQLACADALAANSLLTNVARNQLYLLVRRWLESEYGFVVEGADIFARLPQFVLVANHASHLDAICLLAAMPPCVRNRCYAAAAADYFFVNPLAAQSAKLLANAFPFQRTQEPQRSLEACGRILARGDSLLLFPEGTRSATGQLQRFRKGIGYLVQGTTYPVIPAYLSGAFRALGKGRGWFRRSRLRLRLGQPLTFAHMPTGTESAIVIANQLHDSVLSLKTTQRP